MIIKGQDYIKKLYMENYQKLEEIKKKTPYNYNLFLENDEKSLKLNTNTELLSEKDENFLLYKFVYLKTDLFYMLIMEEQIFKKFLQDIKIFKEINKTVSNKKSEIEELDEEDEIKNEILEDEEEFYRSDLKVAKNEYKSLFLMTYSEEDKNNKRISYKTKMNKLNKNIEHIKKRRDYFIKCIKSGELDYKEYKKIIREEAKIIIKINPSLKYFKILLKRYKELNNYSYDFLDSKWIKSINWELKKVKEIMDILVMYNTRLVIKYVRFYQSIISNNLTFDDIKHEGILGLIHAIYKFDPFKKWKLSTYATWWIKQHIISTINENKNSIKVPLYYSKIISEYEKIKQSNEHEGKKLTDKEISKKMNISERKLKSAKNFVIKNNISLDNKSEEDEDFSLEDIISNEIYNENNNVLNKLEQEELLNFIKKLINEENILNEKEKFIIKHRLSIFTSKPETLQSIAFKMKLTKERIRQLENLALQKITEAVNQYFQVTEKFKELVLDKKLD